MKTKKHPHTLMSDQQCTHAGCRTMIKQNVVDRYGHADKPLICNHHFVQKKKKGGRR